MLISRLREGCPLGGPSLAGLRRILQRALFAICGLVFLTKLLGLGEKVDHQIDLAEIKAAGGFPFVARFVGAVGAHRVVTDGVSCLQTI